MRQQTIAVSSTPNVMIGSIPGDLRVAGWDRSEIMVKTDGDMLEISQPNLTPWLSLAMKT